jgi:predicted DNA-binding transcriptional regulator AlpA
MEERKIDFGMRPKDVAAYLGMSLPSVWRMVADGRLIPPNYASGSPRWRASELAEWFAINRDRPRQRAKAVAAMTQARAQRRVARANETV